MSNSLMNGIVKGAIKFGIKLGNHAPDILVGAGIGLMGLSVVHACKCTTKAEPVIDNHNERIGDIQERVELAKEKKMIYTDKDEREDLAKAYFKTAGDMLKLYWAPIAEFTIGAACILVAHRILNQRVLYLAASYNGLQKAHNEYRDRIRSEYGEDADIYGATGAHKQNYEYTEVAEDGTQKDVTKVVRDVKPSSLSDCAVIFDEGSSTSWTDNALTNLDMIKQAEDYFNNILGYRRDHVLWSDCLIHLGMWNGLDPEKKKKIMGKGWVYDPNDQKCKDHRKINFGIVDFDRAIVNRDMVMGYEPCVWLDPNIDGDVASLF